MKRTSMHGKIVPMFHRSFPIRLLIALSAPIFSCADDHVRAVPSLPTEGPNRLYPGNREPLLPSPLVKLPIGRLTPRGWLPHMLEREASGVPGRLPDVSTWRD